MKQVVVLRGGTTFDTYEEYFDALQNKEVRLERIAYAPGWKESLQTRLGDDYLVLIPSMPNTSNAQYSEWKVYFDQVAKVLKDGCILVGHSMGGIFLAKYLSEVQIPFKAAATILVAAPYDDETNESLGDFRLTGISELFHMQAGNVTIIGAKDDPVIAAEDFMNYQQALPHAQVLEISASDHYIRAEFPELVSVIKAV